MLVLFIVAALSDGPLRPGAFKHVWTFAVLIAVYFIITQTIEYRSIPPRKFNGIQKSIGMRTFSKSAG
jgi:hypothetical protein